ERLASGEQGQLSRAEISRRLKDGGSSGFDPLPYLRQLTVPGLWEFGTADQRTPVDESISILDSVKADGKDITVAIFPNAGHGLLDSPPTDPDAGPTMAWSNVISTSSWPRPGRPPSSCSTVMSS